MEKYGLGKALEPICFIRAGVLVELRISARRTWVLVVICKIIENESGIIEFCILCNTLNKKQILFSGILNSTLIIKIRDGAYYFD